MVISTMMLRSMQQAHYDDVNLDTLAYRQNIIHTLLHQYVGIQILTVHRFDSQIFN